MQVPLDSHEATRHEIGSRTVARQRAVSTASLTEVTAHLVTAQWPVDRAPGVLRENRDMFIDLASTTWLNYMDGDKLIKAESAMLASVDRLKDVSGIWGHNAENDLVDLKFASDKVHALFFCIEAIH